MLIRYQLIFSSLEST